MAFYQGGPFPDSYDGALFFADYSRDCIWAMQKGTNGLPDPADPAKRVTLIVLTNRAHPNWTWGNPDKPRAAIADALAPALA